MQNRSKIRQLSKGALARPCRRQPQFEQEGKFVGTGLKKGAIRRVRDRLSTPLHVLEHGRCKASPRPGAVYRVLSVPKQEAAPSNDAASARKGRSGSSRLWALRAPRAFSVSCPSSPSVFRLRAPFPAPQAARRAPPSVSRPAPAFPRALLS